MGQCDKIRKVDKIEGSCMLVKEKVLDEIGLLDKRFFVYWEETDFCFRVDKKGYKAIYSPKARIWHKIATSSGGVCSPLHTYYMTRNMFLFMKKNAKTINLIKFLLYFFCFRFWFNSGICLYHQDMKEFISFLGGVKDGLTHAVLSHKGL